MTITICGSTGDFLLHLKQAEPYLHAAGLVLVKD
jgi:hypothetical protein